MGLIVFEYFFAAVIFLLGLYLRNAKSESQRILSKIALAASFAIFFLALNIHLLYFNSGYPDYVITKMLLACSSAASFFLTDLVIRFPYFSKNKKIFIFNTVLHSVGVVLILFYIYGLSWNALSGFKFHYLTISGFSPVRTYIILYFFLVPAAFTLILIVKAFRLRSNIYRQQTILFIFSLIAAAVTWFIIYKLYDLFSWVIFLFPLGYVFFVVLAQKAFSVTMIFDVKQIFFAVVRFLVFVFMFAVLIGFISAMILSGVRSLRLQIFLLAICGASALLIQNIVSSTLRFKLGDTTDYGKALAAGLEAIDYTSDRDGVISVFVNLLRTYVDCINIDILISNEQDIFEPAYSTLQNTASYNTKEPVFEFLLKENISILIKSEVVANSGYISVKPELVGFFNRTGSEIAIFVREGQKLIGCIAMGHKLHKGEYTLYDLHVLNDLYSYFFLIVYYLKNIAKQDIMFTVDREIEMSDEIIEAIQKNMDEVKGHSIEVSSASYPAHKLGGDILDFLKLTNDRYFFIIGDISGQGFASSMSIIILKAMLRTFVTETHDFKELALKINLFIKTNLPKETFFAGLLGIMDLNTNTIYYLNCGLPIMAMFIDSYKNVIEIQGEGKVLGLESNIASFLRVRKIKMNAGDVIAFTTDGLLDAQNLSGEKFGNNRFANLVSSVSSEKPAAITESLYNSLLKFVTRKIENDVTILVFKYEKEPNSDAAAE